MQFSRFRGQAENQRIRVSFTNPEERRALENITSIQISIQFTIAFGVLSVGLNSCHNHSFSYGKIDLLQLSTTVDVARAHVLTSPAHVLTSSLHCSLNRTAKSSAVNPNTRVSIIQSSIIHG
jgi:hypothetical protein